MTLAFRKYKHEVENGGDLFSVEVVHPAITQADPEGGRPPVVTLDLQATESFPPLSVGQTVELRNGDNSVASRVTVTRVTRIVLEGEAVL